MNLLERESELCALRTALDAARTGHGRVVLIEGPAGIGKTALVEAACALVPDGVGVFSARGSEVEQALGYGVVRQLFERPTRTGNGFEGAAAAAIAALRPASDAPAASTPPLEVMHGVYWLCANLASEQPLLLTIDDAQWADGPSVQFIEYLARRIQGVPVLLLITRRTSDPGHIAIPFLRIAAEPGAERLTPAPLSDRAVTAVVRDHLGAHAEPAFCHASGVVTGGNPFLVRALLDAIRAAGISPTAGEATRLASMTSEAVSRSISLRLAALPRDAVELATAVGVLGGNAELRHAAHLAELTSSAAAAAADLLTAAAILAPGRPLDFVHPLVRESVYAATPTAERGSSHRRAASLLAADRAPFGRVGVHLLATEPTGDAEVVEMLRVAARESLAQGLPRLAVDYLQRALREPPVELVRADLLRELGTAEQLLGAPSIDHLREALELSRDPDSRIAAARALTFSLLSAERITDVEDVLTWTLDLCADADPERAIRLEAEVLSAARMRLSAGVWSAGRLERWRGKLPGGTPGERLMLANLATQASLGEASAAEAATLAERALGAGQLLHEQTADTMPYYQMVYVLTSADRVQLAATLADAALEDARRRGSLIGTLLASLFSAYTAMASGDIGAADAHSTLALGLSDQIQPPIFHRPACIAAVVDVLVEQDRLDDAEQLLRAHATAGELPDSVPWRILLFSRANLRIAAGRWSDAVSDLVELDRRQSQWRALNPHLNSCDVSAAVSLAGVGRVEEARNFASAALQRAQRWNTPRSIGLALRAGALAGSDSERLALLRHATTVVGRSPARLDQARVLVDLGVAERRAGHRTAAIEALRHALDTAVRCGSVLLASRARDELRTLGLRPRRLALTGSAALTGMERRVAELAAAGKTNRQIAQALFVTIRTVEVHLTHAYQKLGIRSRTEMPGALAQ